MAIFDEQIRKTREFLKGKASTQAARELSKDEVEPWPEGSTLILEEDTALELGNPSIGSLSLVMWTNEEPIEKNKISILGEDIQSIDRKSVPFAQIILVRGQFKENYDAYRSLMDAMYDTQLTGFMTRTMPSRQTIWCRVNRQAVQEGFSLAHLGEALIENLEQAPHVKEVEVIFATLKKEDTLVLQDIAREAEKVVGAMLKLNEQIAHECESCEFWDVCASVEEFKKQRSRILEEQKR